jgi:ribosomal protein S18 acetylase RimI-like enzyme
VRDKTYAFDFTSAPIAVRAMVTDEWDDIDHRLAGLSNIAESSGYDLWMVTVSGKVLGCCGVRFHDNDRGESAKIAVYLKREYRGIGLGESLLKALQKILRVMGASSVFTEVYEGNEAMNGLLDKLGYEVYPSMECGYVVRGMEL